METGGVRRLNRSSPSCLNTPAQRTDFFHGLLGGEMETGGVRRLNRSSPSCLNTPAQRTDFFHGLVDAPPARRAVLAMFKRRASAAGTAGVDVLPHVSGDRGSRRTCRTAGYWSTRSGLPAMRRPRRRSCTTGRRTRSPLDGRVLECRRCELARHGQEAAQRTRHLRQVHQARPCAPGGLGPDGNRECVPLYAPSTDAIDEGNAGTA